MPITEYMNLGQGRCLKIDVHEKLHPCPRPRFSLSLYMYVCIYTYLFMYVRMYLYISIYIYSNIHTWGSEDALRSTCIRNCIRVIDRVSLSIYVCMYLSIHIYLYKVIYEPGAVRTLLDRHASEPVSLP